MSDIAPIEAWLDFKRTLELTGERWLSFAEAVALVRKREPMSIGRAEFMVDKARKSGKVRWHWFHDGDFLLDKPNRGNTFLEEGDLVDWISRHPDLSKASSKQPRQRLKPLRDSTEEIMQTVWPDGPPERLAHKVICAEVRDAFKARNLAPPSPDTIRRATSALRRKS
jgi:hypothetical protein